MIIKKTFRAESTHRLQYSYTKRCQGLHGHSYLFDIYLREQTQDKAQMLMDFSLLSAQLKGFLDAFDHSILIWEEDEVLLKLAPQLNTRYIILPYNTTAEQISRHIYYHSQKIGLPIHRVRVSETSSASAEYMGDDDITIDLNRIIFSQNILDDWE